MILQIVPKSSLWIHVKKLVQEQAEVKNETDFYSKTN